MKTWSFSSFAYSSDVSVRPKKSSKKKFKVSLTSDLVSRSQELLLWEAETQSRHRSVSLHTKGYYLRSLGSDFHAEPLVTDVTENIHAGAHEVQEAVLWAVRLN